MIALALPSLPAALGCLYGAIGVGVAWQVHRKNPDLTAALGALVAWPVYLPLLAGPTLVAGPYSARIVAVFRALETTLADPAAGEVPWDADLTGLRAALQRTDERLALVDRLLAETPSDALRRARERASAEIEAVLEEVVQLRVQIGLAALAGDAASVRDRLAELLLRAKALDEVTAIDG